MRTSARRAMSLWSHKAAFPSSPPSPTSSTSSSSSSSTIQLVLLRHGESEWNASKRFSGWTDIDLTEKGRNQATQAGKLLALHGFEFDEAHASVLKRAVRTLWTALHSSNHHWIPVQHTWRLNERHYGALTGLSKEDARRELGEEMLQRYRRGYDTEPLHMRPEHPCWTGDDRRYRDLGPLLPTGESLKMCKARILPYWHETVMPSVRAGRRVLVAAHNNVIRCLCKHIDGIHRDHLRDFEVPTGAPLVYTLDRETLEPVGDRSAIGFSGTFLTPESSKQLLQREIAAKQREEAGGGMRWFAGGWAGAEEAPAVQREGGFAQEEASSSSSSSSRRRRRGRLGSERDIENDGITAHTRLDELLLENSEQMLEQVGTSSDFGPIDVREVLFEEQLLKEVERLGIDVQGVRAVVRQGSSNEATRAAGAPAAGGAGAAASRAAHYQQR